jgi:hypothetical protein
MSQGYAPIRGFTHRTPRPSEGSPIRRSSHGIARNHRKDQKDEGHDKSDNCKCECETGESLLHRSLSINCADERSGPTLKIRRPLTVAEREYAGQNYCEKCD